MCAKKIVETFLVLFEMWLKNTYVCVFVCFYTLNDSPQPHSPLELGFWKVNSDDNSVSVQSIVVPTTLNNAIGSI